MRPLVSTLSELQRPKAPTSGSPPGDAVGAGLLGNRRAGRGDRLFGGLALGAGLLVLLILAFIAVVTTQQAWPAFASEGFGFVTSDVWDVSNGRFGARALIFGTLVVSLIAVLIAVPVSIGIALFTTEIAGRRAKGPIGLVIDLLAAIPSVVYGLWGALVAGPALNEGVYKPLAGIVGDWPVLGAVFGGPTWAQSFMTAGVILACMITPIITSLSRDVIQTVPSAQREAALALGATRWEMICGSILPWSRSGITGAVMLGLGRAMGETIAVALVIGNSKTITSKIFSPGDAMAGTIANEFGEAVGTHRSALIGLGVVLFVVTILVNMAATKIIARFDVGAKA